MVLTDDDFATIVGAVEQGRTIYSNIVTFVRFQLATNIGAILTLLAAPLLGLPAPFTAVQILWVNIIMDGPPAMALGLDPPTPGAMDDSAPAPTVGHPHHLPAGRAGRHRPGDGRRHPGPAVHRSAPTAATPPCSPWPSPPSCSSRCSTPSTPGPSGSRSSAGPPCATGASGGRSEVCCCSRSQPCSPGPGQSPVRHRRPQPGGVGRRRPGGVVGGVGRGDPQGRPAPPLPAAAEQRCGGALTAGGRGESSP